MTREDIENLFKLLALYRPKDRHLEDDSLKALWALTLEPYSPEDVKAAVAAYFREQKYWPDVTDIAVRCPTQPVKPPPPLRRDTYRDPIVEDMFRQWKCLAAPRREHGLPVSAGEARAAGLNADQWFDLLDKAHLTLGGDAV